METETFEENLPGSPEESLEIVAPFLPRNVLTELCSGRHYQDYREQKIQRLREGTAAAMQRQRLIASFNAGIQAREVGGFRRVMSIDPLLYMAAREKYGADCWRDPDFRRHTIKHTPEVRVPEPERKTMILTNGFRDEISRRPETGQENGAGHGAPDDDRPPFRRERGQGEPGTAVLLT